MDQALAKWIEAHPYLPPIARVQEIVAHAAGAGAAQPAVGRQSPGDAVRHRSMVWRSRPIGCPHGDDDDSDRLTLHLDLLARDRGYERFGASLVEV